jgi:hypothetical protein
VTGEWKTVCNVGGITLNFLASQLVTFAKMKKMILSTDVDETVILRTKNKVKRKRCERGVSIISQPEKMMYRISSLKRSLVNNNKSLPFGYIYNK